MKRIFISLIAVLSLLCAGTVAAQSHEEELAKKLNNPIASLISVPFQYNYDDRTVAKLVKFGQLPVSIGIDVAVRSLGKRHAQHGRRLTQ